MVVPLTQTTANESPKPKRHWFQFSLRTLLVMTVIFSCGLGWVANERRKNTKYQSDYDALCRIGNVQFFIRRWTSPPNLAQLLGDDRFRNIQEACSSAA